MSEKRLKRGLEPMKLVMEIMMLQNVSLGDLKSFFSINPLASFSLIKNRESRRFL